MVVPYSFLSEDVMDSLGFAHDSVPRAASILDDLASHQLIDPWRRQYSQILHIDDDSDKMQLVFTLLNLEPIICIMTDTGSTPFDVNNDPDLTSIAQRRNGIASLGAGVKRAEIRADVGYIGMSRNRHVLNR